MSRRKRNARGQKAWLDIIGIVLIIVTVITALGYFIYKRPPELYLANNCPKEQGISKRSVAFLIDTTEKISATQKERIKGKFYCTVSAIEGYDRVTIYEVEPASQNLLKPNFDYCKPASEELGNPVLDRFSEINFKQNIEQYFENATYGRNISPIIEAIGSLAASFPRNEASRHLIIASDFMENSELLNQLKPDWKNQLKGNKAINDKRPDLRDVKVSLLFIPISKYKHHNKKFLDWWIEYLQNSGAQITDQEFFDPKSEKECLIHSVIPITG